MNILAFQSYVDAGESLARFVADDMASAKAVLGSLRMIFEETDVAVVRLAHRPGESGRAASRLGDNQINIDYSYCGQISSPDSQSQVERKTFAILLVASLEATDLMNVGLTRIYVRTGGLNSNTVDFDVTGQ